MKDFARGFYKSKAWQDCRRAYIKSVGGLCERCLKKGIYRAGVIVHHLTVLTPETIQDPTVTLNFDALELLCMDCHNKEHLSKGRRYRVDEMGKVIFP